MFKKTSIAIFVFIMSLAPLWAVTPEQLGQLAGKTTDGIQASQYGKIYRDAFANLIEQMEKTTGDTRYGHQVMLQDICLHASRSGAEKQRAIMSKALAETLQSKTMTPEIRYWVLLQIERTGKGEVLEVLTKSLGSADKIEQGCARAAIEKNSARQATRILLKALAGTEDEAFAAGLISSLGNRKAHRAVDAIGQQLDHTNSTIAMAAVTALEKINTPDAVSLLKQKLSPDHLAAGAIAKSLLDIAAGSAASKANAIYSDLYVWSGKVKPASRAYSIRKAALIGLAANDSAGIDKMIIAAFKADDPAVKSMAIAAAEEAKSSIAAKAMAGESDKLDNVLQSQLIVMLASRDEPSVMGPIKHAANSSDGLLLRTVVDTLTQIETKDSASMLLKMTRNSDGSISRYASQKLVRADNDHIDALLRKVAGSGNDKRRAGAIVLLGERKTPNVTEQLLKYAQSDNETVYKSALKAVGLSVSADKVPVLCGMVKTSTSDSYQKLVLAAIQQVLSNSKDKKAAYAIIIKEIKAADQGQKADLITTLRMCGDEDAMNFCLGLLSDAESGSFESAIPKATLATLAYWSDPALAKHLLARAKTSEHKSAYAQAAVDLAKNMMRYSKDQAKKIAKEVKALNMSEAINQSADRVISSR